MCMIKKIIYSMIASLLIISTAVQIYANNPVSYIAFAGDNLLEQTNELIMLGDTTINDNGLMLTQDVNQASGVFLNDALSMKESVDTKGFSLHYNLTVFKQSDTLGEGIGFVFTNNEPQLGTGGAALGFGGIEDSISFELDFISNDNDFNAPHYGTYPTFDGAYISGSEGVGLNLDLAGIYSRATFGRRAFDLYVWLDYSSNERMMDMYVSTIPVRPDIPLKVSVRADLDQIDKPVYPGITTSNTENAMGLRLNAMYVSDYLIEDSLNASNYQYISDRTEPTEPILNILSLSGKLSFSVSGSTDAESGVRGYEYSYDLIEWFEGTLVISESAQTIHFRAFDRAQNRSDIVTYETFVLSLDTDGVGNSYQIVLYVGQDFEMSTGARNTDYIITSWELEDGTEITNASELTTSTTLYAQTQKHTYNIFYDVGLGIQEGNPNTHSILDEDITLLPAKRSGYAFTGWFLNDVQVETLNADIPQDIQLEARYEPLILDYVIYGHNNQTQTLTLTTRLRFGSFSSVRVPVGYEFVGFYTEPFGQGERITEGTIIRDVETFQAFPFIRSINFETSSNSMLSVQSVQPPIDNNQPIEPMMFIPFLVIGLLIFVVRRGKHE